VVQVGLIKSPGSTNGGGKLRVVSDMSENEAEREMFSDDKGKSTEMEHGAEITLSGRLFQTVGPATGKAGRQLDGRHQYIHRESKNKTPNSCP